MKKWVFWLVILLVLGYGVAQYKPKVFNGKPPEHNQFQEVTPQNNEHTIKVTTDQIYKGNLLLVNKDHPVPPSGEESEAVNLFQHKELLKGFIVLDNTIQLSPSLVQKFTTMIGAAAKDGVSRFLISSGLINQHKRTNLLWRQADWSSIPKNAQADNFSVVDGSVISIIGDESRSFFSEQKSAEAVAKLIQNKATTFLNE